MVVKNGIILFSFLSERIVSLKFLLKGKYPNIVCSLGVLFDMQRKAG